MFFSASYLTLVFTESMLPLLTIRGFRITFVYCLITMLRKYLNGKHKDKSDYYNTVLFQFVFKIRNNNLIFFRSSTGKSQKSGMTFQVRPTLFLLFNKANASTIKVISNYYVL